MSRLTMLSPNSDARDTNAAAQPALPAAVDMTTSSVSKLRAEPSLGRLLRRANRLVQSTIEARFGAADLNFTQWSVLDGINRAGPMTVGELAAAMQMPKSALARVTDGLEARHLLARERNVADRRMVTLSLTQAGCAKLVEIGPISARRCDKVLAGLTEAEIEHLMMLLSKLADSIERNAFVAGRPVVEA